MKVVLYNHTSSVSGAEINLLVTAAQMAHVHLVLYAPEGELLERARAQGLETVVLSGFSARLSRNPLKLAAGIGGMLRAGWRFASAVRGSGADVIHANSMRAGMMASMFRWRHRIPAVWHLHDMPPKGIIGSLIKLFAGLSARSLIAISRSVSDGMRTKGLSDRIHLVHNGTEPSVFREEDREWARKALRTELQTPLDSRVLLIIGQITPWKRQEDAIKAASALAKEGQNVYLWIVGEPKFRTENEQYLQQLKQLAAELGTEERIRFTGFRDDVAELCCAADVLLLCSANEPFGRVVIEAMAERTPVIATGGGGIPDIIEHGLTGLLYETGDIDSLVRHARELLDNERYRIALGERGQQRIADCFSIGQTVRLMEQVYEAAAHKDGKPAAQQTAVRGIAE
ncbi:glycosyltransferase family 4 protein [Paenibacillus sp. NEAU-GSW1]|uniref:glycosyltransferase family 4 protein n=1 Tax=Paenibacillus sp. NEAU-GSW1 TaxID=2682486 RepID=UPI0012E287D7|nr:glycosyltransferase family 4 protein [Paenibacillus sp. NEAU-GSW1]MUT68055.1 glycosyltransferase [Paenibacillus sp. NEAU-GSW1]